MHCFQRAVEHDPDCLTGYWRIGYAAGPNYNKPRKYFVEEDLRMALSTCHEAGEQGLERELRAQKSAHSCHIRAHFTC